MGVLPGTAWNTAWLVCDIAGVDDDHTVTTQSYTKYHLGFVPESQFSAVTSRAL